ncbi:MAG: ABC transporter permease [Lachnospiraceae bacterium]|nr:ABC transporter permease [Lachnospiraceae bacterium]
MTLVLSVLEQGMIYAIMALGLYITYKILDFPDLTVDGSFPMGVAITALMISKDMNPLLTLPVSFLLGALVGICTGLIHVKLKVRDLLSGIIMMTALYTVNLRIAGRANLPIYNNTTIFDNDFVNAIVPESLSRFKTVLIILIITLIVKYILDWYLHTRSGYILRAVGDNEAIVTAMAVDKGKIKIIGLAIANGLVSLSGCVFAQQQRFFDISMGTGTMVIGLASVIIGTSLFKKITVMRVTSSVIVGSIIYKACVAIAIKFGFGSTDLKFITAALFLFILVIGKERNHKVKEKPEQAVKAEAQQEKNSGRR